MKNNKRSNECPICKAKGISEIKEAYDRTKFVAGSWQYFRCSDCECLWQYPKPTKLETLSFYDPFYYTHERPVEPFGRNLKLLFGRFRLNIKKYLLAKFWGYSGLINNNYPVPLSYCLANMTFCLKQLKNWAAEEVRFISYKNEGHLLDVGCGNGEYLLLMKSLGWTVKGLEVDSSAAEIAKSNGLNIIDSTIEEAELGKEEFDAITLSHAIEHFSDPVSALEKMWVALKPGGRLVSIAPNPNGFLVKIFKENWSGLEAPRHLSFLSVDSYKKIFKNSEADLLFFTSNSRATSWFRDGLILKNRKRLGSNRGWMLSKLFRIFVLLPICSFFPTRGEELVCIIKKKS